MVCKKHGVRHSPASDVTSILTCHRAWVAAVRKPRQVENSGQLAWLTEGRILPNSQTRPCGLVSHRARAKNSAAFVRYSSLIVIAIPGLSLTHLLGRTQTAGDGSATRQKKKGCRGKAALAPRCYRHFGGWGRAGSTELTFTEHVRSNSNSFAASHPFSIAATNAASHVRFWPLADMPSCTAHVRFRG
jgi:hypothetical protein